jgi:hypothetical protein
MKNRRLEGSSDVLVGRWLPRLCHQCQARAAIGHVGIEHNAFSIVMAMEPSGRPSCPARGQERGLETQGSAKDAWGSGARSSCALQHSCDRRNTQIELLPVRRIDSIHSMSLVLCTGIRNHDDSDERAKLWESLPKTAIVKRPERTCDAFVTLHFR